MKAITFHPNIKIINNNSNTNQPLEMKNYYLDILVYSLIRTLNGNFVQISFAKKS